MTTASRTARPDARSLADLAIAIEPPESYDAA